MVYKMQLIKVYVLFRLDLLIKAYWTKTLIQGVSTNTLMGSLRHSGNAYDKNKKGGINTWHIDCVPCSLSQGQKAHLKVRIVVQIMKV